MGSKRLCMSATWRGGQHGPSQASLALPAISALAVLTDVMEARLGEGLNSYRGSDGLFVDKKFCSNNRWFSIL